jgi:hypothetical protein
MTVSAIIRENVSTADKLLDMVAELQAENAKLKAFSRIMIEEAFEGHDVEAFDIQAVAARHGLIVPREATEDDVAAGIDCEVGDDIFQFDDWMAE